MYTSYFLAIWTVVVAAVVDEGFKFDAGVCVAGVTEIVVWLAARVDPVPGVLVDEFVDKHKNWLLAAFRLYPGQQVALGNGQTGAPQASVLFVGPLKTYMTSKMFHILTCMGNLVHFDMF